MNVALAAILVTVALSPSMEVSALPSTRLFVHHMPRGAALALYRRPLGEPDAPFHPSLAKCPFSMELDQNSQETWRVQVQDARITGLDIQLRKAKPADSHLALAWNTAVSPDVDQVPAEFTDCKQASGQVSVAAEAAAVLVSQADSVPSIRQAMLTVLRQHPGQTRWSGRDGNRLFGIAVKPLPKGESSQRAVPAMLGVAQMLAVHEILSAKSLLDCYATEGLTDATTLRRAVELAAGQLQVTGRVKGVMFQAAVRSGFAVAYVVADRTELSAHLLQPVELGKVQAAYRDVMHRQARELMARGVWSDALLLWRHLHQRKLVSQQLYLDAARCFKQLNQSSDAVRVLSEALEAFADSNNPDFFEQAGDIALEIETESAQIVAEAAYQKAIDTLRETISGGGQDEAYETPP